MVNMCVLGPEGSDELPWSFARLFVALLIIATPLALSALQAPAVEAVDENVLRQYAGVYQSDADGFFYLQLWNEFSGFDKPGQLVSFNESGEVRVLFPTATDRFFTGPAVAIPT